MFRKGLTQIIPIILIALVGVLYLLGSAFFKSGVSLAESDAEAPDLLNITPREYSAALDNPQGWTEQVNQAPDVLEDFTNPPGADWGVLFSEDAIGQDIILADDNYVVAGYGVSPNETVFDYWTLLARFDLNGNLLDSKKYDHDDPNVTYSVIHEPVSGNFTLAGWKYFHDGPYYDSWVWMISVNGTLDRQWEAVHGSPFHDWGNAIIPDADGYIIGGWEGISTGYDGWGYMVRTHANGTLDWEVRRIPTDNTTAWLATEIYSVERTSDGGAILGTQSGLVKVNFASPPTFEWRSGEGRYFAAKQTSDGGYIGVGEKEVSSTWKQDDRDILVVTKLDATGNVTWTYDYGNQRPIVGSTDIDDVGYDVIEVSDGYVIAGETESWAYHGNTDLWVVKTDLSGIMEWDLVLGGESFDEGRAIVAAPGGGYTITGYAGWDGASRIWMVKIPDSGFTRPEASFTFSPPSPFFVEQRVDFDASASYDPDGSLVSYLWDFGDNTTGTGMMPRHTYTVPGTYTTTLYVIDNDGVIDYYSLSITVKELEMQWEKSYGDAFDYGGDIAHAPDGGYVVAGRYHWGAGIDLWIYKTDSRGNVIWDKTYDGGYEYGDRAYAIIPAHESGYIVGGYSTNTTSTTQIWLLKISDADGSIVWQKFYGWKAGINIAMGLGLTGDGGYIVTGLAASGESDNDYDMLLLKVDVAGNEEWHETYPDPGGQRTAGFDVIETADGGYAITGGYDSSNYVGPLLTVKVKADRTEDWRVNTGDDESCGSWITQTPDYGYVVAGSLEGDFCLQKYLPSGVVEWSHTWDPAWDDYVYDAASMVDGGYMIVGRKDLYYGGDEAVYLVRTDASGNLLWDWVSNEDDPEEKGQGILTYSDGSCVILFSRDDYSGTGLSSCGLLKLGPNIPPNASFNYSPDNPEAGEPVTFDASASFDEDGSIVAWEWDFDTGDNATGETTFYSFPDNGTYEVTLTVVDDQDGVDIITDNVTVAVELSVDFTANTTSGPASLSVGFASEVTGGVAPFNYAWDMNNDLVVDSTEAGPFWVYTDPGVYTVSLEATDDVSSIDTETKADYIKVTGITTDDPEITITTAEVSDDPSSDPDTYDPTGAPEGIEWDTALGFVLGVTGPDGTYMFQIHFSSPVTPDFVLYKLPGWTEITYTILDDYTIEVTLEISGGVLDPPFVLSTMAFTCGDVNNDGNVNMADVMILWYDIADYPSAGAWTISDEAAADVNCDGNINMADVMILWYDIADYPSAGAWEVNCCE